MRYERNGWRYGSPAKRKRVGCLNRLKDGRDDTGIGRPRLRLHRRTAIATTALAAALLAVMAQGAGATVWTNFTNSGFITMLPGDDTLTITFDGKSASHADNMDIILSSGTEGFIVGNNAAVGTAVTVNGLTPGRTYNLELIDTATGQRWSSDPAKDGATVGSVTYTSDLINNSGESCSHGNSCAQAPHLAFTTIWSNFGFAGPSARSGGFNLLRLGGPAAR